MKNIYRFLLFIVAFTAFSFSGQAQYRNYQLQGVEEIAFDIYGDPISTIDPSLPNKKDPTEVRPFEFEINFRNLNELFRLEAAKLAAARRAYARWLAKQRGVLLKEINKQLGTDHTNFNTAKNDFFRNYEKWVERAASTEAWEFSQKAKALDQEQRSFTTELYHIKEWERSRSWCKGDGLGTGICEQLSSTKIRGKTLGGTNATGLDQLYSSALKDFHSREFGSAQNIAWGTGIRRIIDDGSLLNTMANKHIKYFDALDSEVQVYLMINYLSGFYTGGAGPVQIRLPHPKYAILSFWENSTIVTMGKKRAPPFRNKDLSLLAPGYIKVYVDNCNDPDPQWTIDNCGTFIADLYKRRDEIIQRHIDELGLDDKIINELTGKAECVYEKLLRTTITDLGIMQNTYIAFNKDLNYKEHFLTYRLGELPEGVSGLTRTISPINFEITLNPNMISNRSPIEIARTLIHESIHALLRKQMRSDGQESFITIFSKYIEKTKGKELQHAIMAEEYITPLSNALKKYDGAKESDSFYKNLAWNGIPKQFRDPGVTDSEIQSAIDKARNKGLKCN